MTHVGGFVGQQKRCKGLLRRIETRDGIRAKAAEPTLLGSAWFLRRSAIDWQLDSSARTIIKAWDPASIAKYYH
jgi:hypothetical protein